MKTLFNEYGALNDSGLQANAEAHRFIKDFFERWVAWGHSEIELEHILISEATCTGAVCRLTKAVKLRKERDNVG